jgi:hypothetical protein
LGEEIIVFRTGDSLAWNGTNTGVFVQRTASFGKESGESGEPQLFWERKVAKAENNVFFWKGKRRKRRTTAFFGKESGESGEQRLFLEKETMIKTNNGFFWKKRR